MEHCRSNSDGTKPSSPWNTVRSKSDATKPSSPWNTVGSNSYGIKPSSPHHHPTAMAVLAPLPFYHHHPIIITILPLSMYNYWCVHVGASVSRTSGRPCCVLCTQWWNTKHCRREEASRNICTVQVSVERPVDCVVCCVHSDGTLNTAEGKRPAGTSAQCKCQSNVR